MNVEFWNNHQSTSLASAMSMLKDSFYDVMKMIDEFSNDKLLAKGSPLWTGTSTLGSYCGSATLAIMIGL